MFERLANVLVIANVLSFNYGLTLGMSFCKLMMNAPSFEYSIFIATLYIFKCC